MRVKAVQRDANEPVIIAAIRSLGWLVQTLSGDGVPDLLCWTGRRLILVEVKDGAKQPNKQKLTDAQVAWHREWAAAPVYVAACVADVEDIARKEAA